MKINTKLPSALLEAEVDSVAAFKQALDRVLPKAESLAKRAFLDNDRQSWEEVQEALYVLNTDDMERLTDPASWQSILNKCIRNILENIQNSGRTPYQLKLKESYTCDRALQYLYEAATGHRINTHPLLIYMAENGLPQEVVRTFLDNYYVNNRLFHLHLATLCLNTPLHARHDLTTNLYDELGGDEAEMAHPLLFLRSYNSIGLSKVITPLAESMFLLNTKAAFSHLSSDYRKGFGGFGFIEITMPKQMRFILAGLERSGLPKADLIFWDLHITVDERHGDTWFDEMRELITTEEDANIIFDGGMRLLDARAAFYDGVWRYAQPLLGVQSTPRRAVACEVGAV